MIDNARQATAAVYRVQAADGRGPYRPGLTQRGASAAGYPDSPTARTAPCAPHRRFAEHWRAIPTPGALAINQYRNDRPMADDEADALRPAEMHDDGKRLLIVTHGELFDDRELLIFFDEEGNLSITADQGEYRDSHDRFDMRGTVIVPREYAIALAKWILAHGSGSSPAG